MKPIVTPRSPGIATFPATITSLYMVGQLLGHIDLEVTKIYAHLTPRSLAPVVEDLDFEIDSGGKSDTIWP